jgi:nicotinamidase-related amidase
VQQCGASAGSGNRENSAGGIKVINPALVVVDPQNDCFAAGNPNIRQFQNSVLVINSAIGLFHRQGWPVVFMQHTSREKPLGSRQWAIHNSFDVRPGDVCLPKSHKDAFVDTHLDLLLAGRDVELVVIAGYMSEGAVLATYHAALRHDYRAAILRGGVASLDREAHRLLTATTRQISLEELWALPGATWSTALTPYVESYTA